MKLEILTPQKTLFSGSVNSVTLPGTLGAFTVLAGHAPMIASLCEDGEITYTSENKTEKLVIRGGFAEVWKNHVTVCAE
ncbi:MAG: ATP synthase F1 subunit epsilon [Bacteroidales bacterium]|nr:ATP synthase F1 subunit epsilon [Bacteroidales bacterium]